MLKDQKELLAALNDHGVEYVVIGGHAAIAYGAATLTKDLVVLVRSGEKNSVAVYKALAAFGAPMEPLAPTDFRDNPDVSADHLVRNKELVGRPGDLADVYQLRKIRDIK